MSSHSSDHPQEVLLAQFSLSVHKGGLKTPFVPFIYSEEAESEKCSRNRLRGNTLLQCGIHFFLVDQGLRPKDNVVSVATSCVFRL